MEKIPEDVPAEEASKEGQDNAAFEQDRDDDHVPVVSQVECVTKFGSQLDLISTLVPPASETGEGDTVNEEKTALNPVSGATVNLGFYEVSLTSNSSIKGLTLNRSVTKTPCDLETSSNSDSGEEGGAHRDEEEDLRCGLGCFSPAWIQRFATKPAFLALFSLLGIIQGMTWSYFTSTITTLEKRFKISTQTAGIVMTGNEISQILFSIFIAYYGGKGHRPRWIAVGVLFSALSCFVLASPQAFYGSGDDMLALTEEYGHFYHPSYQELTQVTPLPDSASLEIPTDMSTENDLWNGATSTPTSETPSIPIHTTLVSSSATPNKRGNAFSTSAKAGRRVNVCQRRDGDDRGFYQAQTGSKQGGVLCGTSTGEALDSVSSLAPLIIIFLSQFVAGIGNLLFFSLGGPYLDDNTNRENMPKVLGCTMSLRLVGPTLGYLIASGTLKIFVNPWLTPTITPDDPRWQGAWWLGWTIFGTVMMFLSVFIALFPRRLRRKTPPQLSLGGESPTAESVPKLREIPGAVKSLLRNKVNLFNNLAGVFYLFSAIGYWTYMPKYLETIFMQTASRASIMSGVVGILFQAAGMMLSGFLISKWQPSARKLAFWNVLIAFTSVTVLLGFTQLGCNVGNISFGSRNPTDGTWNLTTGCNAGCHCKTSRILPVCHVETNTVYYSACHAGCTGALQEDNTIADCKCVPGTEAGIPEGAAPSVKLGTCSEGCSGVFLLFLGITALVKFFDGTGRIGNMLLSYRCVQPKDRSLSIGLNILLISLFAFLPSPILFGWIIDNVCLVWGGGGAPSCRGGGGGSKGNCMLYDGQQLRYIFNLTAAAFTLVGGILDCLVLYCVKDLELYREPEEGSLKQKQSTNHTE